MAIDSDYYAARERQERVIAASCADLRIAAIHVAMAETYSSRVGDPNGLADGEQQMITAPIGEAHSTVA